MWRDNASYEYCLHPNPCVWLGGDSGLDRRQAMGFRLITPKKGPYLSE